MDKFFLSYANTTDKFLIETYDLIKKRWLKTDKVKMQELLKKKQKTEKEQEDAYNKYIKLRNKFDRIEKAIDKLNTKYTYTKKHKVKNPNYQEGGMPV
tara:strand:- start:133 stop:426 length:294 start_codon:yes stop_codon:yes gene_type:complete